MAECKHEIDEATCHFCRPRASAEPEHVPDPRRFGPWFSAGYDGDCDGCGELIMEGDRIRSDGQGGWLCGECGDVTPRPDDGRVPDLW